MLAHSSQHIHNVDSYSTQHHFENWIRTVIQRLTRYLLPKMDINTFHFDHFLAEPISLSIQKKNLKNSIGSKHQYYQQ